MSQAGEHKTEANRLPADERAPSPPPQSAEPAAEHPLRRTAERFERRGEESSSLQRLIWFQVSQAMFAPTSRRATPPTVCGGPVLRERRARAQRPDL